jgi:hypothetical protein
VSARVKVEDLRADDLVEWDDGEYLGCVDAVTRAGDAFSVKFADAPTPLVCRLGESFRVVNR